VQYKSTQTLVVAMLINFLSNNTAISISQILKASIYTLQMILSIFFLLAVLFEYIVNFIKVGCYQKHSITKAYNFSNFFLLIDLYSV